MKFKMQSCSCWLERSMKINTALHLPLKSRRHEIHISKDIPMRATLRLTSQRRSPMQHWCVLRYLGFMIKQDWTTDHREWYRKVYLTSDHWKSLRASKLANNPKCERCNSASCLDVHHVNYKNLFDVELSDMLTLCRKCHNLEHEQNGMPRRKKISYLNYFPKSAVDAINSQKAAVAEKRRTTPHFNFKTKQGQTAYSIWNNPSKWRSSDQKKLGIPNPKTISPEWWFSDGTKEIRGFAVCNRPEPKKQSFK